MSPSVAVNPRGTCAAALRRLQTLLAGAVCLVVSWLPLTAEAQTLQGAVQVASGQLHSCALTAGSAVVCWGDNTFGQLGDGGTATRTSPVTVQGLGSGIRAIAVGAFHTCALSLAGAVKCWGDNASGQLGDGSTTDRRTPVDVQGIAGGISAIGAGGAHSCAVNGTGGVVCWGGNSSGQLGDNSTLDRLAPVAVQGLGSGVTAVVSGSDHTCALTQAGGVLCWGRNGSGQLGDDSLTTRLTPVAVQGLASGTVELATAGDHTCARTQAGGVLCWGSNDTGQLGDNSDVARQVPVAVAGLGSGVTAITAGAGHSCALGAAGVASCWGDNASGQLGDNSSLERRVPVAVQGLGAGTSALSAGGSHSCAIGEAGQVRCWGDNLSGQLGDGTLSLRTSPATLAGLSTGAQAVAVGEFHSCARTDAGGVKCWGENDYGQLGDGSTTKRLAPTDVQGLAGVITAVAAGAEHSCALNQAGAVQCWGNNDVGQLGDGSIDSRLTPVAVLGLASGTTAIAVGGNHACALTAQGGVKCWGANGNGQLGDGSTTLSATPVDVQGLAAGVIAITAGRSHSCAVIAGGGLRCWGDNASGQLGDNSNVERLTPVDATGLGSGLSAVAGGGDHSCALGGGGGVVCWGENFAGQLGDGSTVARLTRVDVAGLGSGVGQIAAGDLHSCARTVAGAALCWGDNRGGQIGDASFVNRSTPVTVQGLASGVAAIAAGARHSCAVTQAGGVLCWGENQLGQLGIGGRNYALPAAVVAVLPLTVFKDGFEMR